MVVKLTKNENDYSLTISSGHFSGTLSSISKEKLKELSENIEKIINDSETTPTVIWNPRSHRHEIR